MKTVERIELPGIPMRRRQQGAVLIVSLLLLLVMTLIGVTAMSTTSLEEKMSGNMRDKNMALQASEAALEGGETWVNSQASQPSTCSTSPCTVWQLNTLPDLSSQAQTWWLANGTSDSSTMSGVQTAPRYLVEEQAFVRDNLDSGQNASTGVIYYRITSHGTGGTDDAKAILQSTYAKRFN